MQQLRLVISFLKPKSLGKPDLVAASGDKAYISLPNALSLFRIIATPFFLYFAYTGQDSVALILFLLAAVTDWADGFFARFLQQESKFGALLDPIADKVLLMGSFLGFYLMGKVPIWMMLIVVGRDVMLLLGGLVILVKKYDFHMRPARLSKFNTLMQILYIAAIVFYGPQYLMDGLSVITATTTILSAILYLHVFKTWYNNH